MDRLIRCTVWGVVAGVIVALGAVVIMGVYSPHAR